MINDTSVLSIFISSCLHLNRQCPDNVLEFFPSSREENILSYASSTFNKDYCQFESHNSNTRQNP